MILFDTNEKILFSVRRHWFIMAQRVFLLLIALILPIMGFLSLNVFFPDIVNTVENVWALEAFAISLWALLLWIIFFVEYTDFYFDVWHITNERIVDVEQHGLFHREVSSVYFEKVQDVTMETKGFIASVLKFGDLHVQTAGGAREIILKGTSNPHEAKRILLEQYEAARQRLGAIHRGEHSDM